MKHPEWTQFSRSSRIRTSGLPETSTPDARRCGQDVGQPSLRVDIVQFCELGSARQVLLSMLAEGVEPLLAILATMLREFARPTKQVLDIVRPEPICPRLMSVPSVGPITALIDRPDRFRRSRNVGAHLGLTPGRYRSGETVIQGKISRCGDELARTALYEAAHTLLVRSCKWSSLRAWGMQIAKRRGMARAGRRRTQARRHSAPHVARPNGAPLRQGAERAAA
jgi:transposase